MVSSAVATLAKSLGVTLSSRSCSGSFLWDGKTLATHWQRWDNNWSDHIWETEHRVAERFLSNLIPIPDDSICHDMGHFLVSHDWCRDLPEFGLNWAVGAVEYGANGGVHLWSKQQYTDAQWLKAQSTMDGLLGDEEQNHQEHLAYLLGLVFCLRTGTRLSKATSIEWIREYASGERRHPCITEVLKYGVSPQEIAVVLDLNTWEK